MYSYVTEHYSNYNNIEILVRVNFKLFLNLELRILFADIIKQNNHNLFIFN